jgi:Arc/MetJ family transcription regulator
MRTTVTLDDDVAAAVERARRERGEGLSSVINRLVRRGLRSPDAPVAFEQRTQRMGLRIDVANVSEALELLDGPTQR